MPPPEEFGEPFATFEVHLFRQVNGFGFRIIGGREEGSQVRNIELHSPHPGMHAHTYVHAHVINVYLSVLITSVSILRGTGFTGTYFKVKVCIKFKSVCT